MSDKKRFGKTKIVCTIGPATQSVEQLVKLIQAGMDVARLNFSHGSHQDHLTTIQNIRAASAQTGEHISILQDLCGPKIRTGTLQDKQVELHAGSSLTFTTEEIIGTAQRVTTAYKELPADVKPGDTILLDDGKLSVQVVSVKGAEVQCKILVGGILGEHKGMNLPGVKLSTPSITEKDIDDLYFGLANEVDYVALSFVRSSKDIRSLREHIRAKTKHFTPIIAKIEMGDAINAIDDIIAETDSIMVARGDLGVELPPEEVPMLQKMIVRKCNEVGKPVIIATQMLESMIENPRPTRAEASDVANAVLDGTDAVMLSAETSIGKYPIETVQTMDNIIQTTERQITNRTSIATITPNYKENVLDAIAHSACVLAHQVNASVIVCITHSGGTAKRISRFRPDARIIAVTGAERVLRLMNLVWGVRGMVVSDYIGNADATLKHIKEKLKADGYVQSGDYIVFTMGIPLMARGLTDTINVVPRAIDFKNYFFNESIFEQASTTFSTEISFIHRKCFLGHDSRPICEQGRHERSFRSNTTDFVPTGKNPSSFTVEPKMATRFRFIAAATCINPVSLHTTRSQDSITAAVSSNEYFPHRFSAKVFPVAAFIASAILPQ